MRAFTSIILTILLAFSAIAQTISIDPESLAIPDCPECDQTISHYAYTVGYEKDAKQPRWVGYVLTSGETNSVFERTNNFGPDPKLNHPSATVNDYKGSGYDRGHLAPAADMGWSSTTMRESFYFSNMSPQEPGFNRGIWLKLEKQVRGWAVENGAVVVVTGCIFDNPKGYIGRGLPVPSKYYKVLLDYSEPEIKAIGFILPNQKSAADLSTFAYSVDYVESVTGIDFFTQLPDDIETMLEGGFDISQWPFTGFSSSGSLQSSSTSVQCKGNTKAVARCKNMTKNENGYCHLHQNQVYGMDKQVEKSARRSISVQCSAITQKGTRCKRMTKSPNGRCWQHGGD
jgi:endonuclease G, mitochondrial